MKNESKTLELLFALKPEAIAQDLGRAHDDLRDILKEISSLQAIPLSDRTPETEAQIAHLLMVQANELCHRDVIEPEVQTFYAAFGAGNIAQYAETLAADQSTCAELSAQMKAIRRREGLEDDEFWVRLDEGPDDYRKLSGEFSRVVHRVYDTVFVHVLRLYHLHDHADLFEHDPAEFEIQREIGCRAVARGEKETEGQRIMDDYIRREYGQASLDRILARVKEIREKSV